MVSCVSRVQEYAMFYQPYENYLEDSKDMGVAFCINYSLEFLRIFFYKLFVKYRIVFLKQANSNSPDNSLYDS